MSLKGSMCGAAQLRRSPSYPLQFAAAENGEQSFWPAVSLSGVLASKFVAKFTRGTHVSARQISKGRAARQRSCPARNGEGALHNRGGAESATAQDANSHAAARERYRSPGRTTRSSSG